MRRRAVIALFGGALLAWPGIGVAQIAAARAIVAVVTPRSPETMKVQMSAFAQGMQEFGLVAGREYDLVFRSTNGDITRAPALLSDLIGLKPEVIVTQDTPLTLAAKRATQTIPIVGAFIADPVGLGLVASIAHPGGNVTGLLSTIDKLIVKKLELLLQVVPNVTRIGVLFNANNPANVAGARVLQSDLAARSLRFVPAPLHQSGEIDAAFHAFADAHVEAVFVFQDVLFTSNEVRIAALALAARLPTVFGFRGSVEAGGL